MQTLLERLSIGLSKLSGDQVSIYTADGETIKAAKREEAVNSAALRMFDEKRKGLTDAEFMNNYPIFRSEKVILINGSLPYSLGIEKTPGIIKVLDCYVNAWEPIVENKQAGRLTEDTYYNALTFEYSHFKPTLAAPKYYERDKVIEIHVANFKNQITISNGTIKLIVFAKPVYTEFDPDGEDILLPDEWYEETVSLAYEILNSSNQN